jgi:hypothetical protein
LPDVADLDRIEAQVTDFIAEVGKTASYPSLTVCTAAPHECSRRSILTFLR